MAFSSLLLILIVLATAGYSNGEHCKDKYMCAQKPNDYDSIMKEHRIYDIVNNAKDFIDKTIEPLDENEERVTGDDDNCWGITTIETPYVIKTNVSEEYYVVQSPILKQKIRVTRCQKSSQSCFESVKSIKYRATCEQKLAAMSVYIYDPEVKGIRYKMFEVPICCVCQLHNDYK